MTKNNLILYVALVLVLIFTGSGYTKIVSLHIPIVEDSPKLHLYFHELLEHALKEEGYDPDFTTMTLPQLRVKSFLDHGRISIYWMVESEERNRKLIPIQTGLTNGLIGKRVLFIKKGDQPLFDGVKTLEDFRNLNLVGGMGEDWYDVRVWKVNRLKCKEHPGNWKSIFNMIPYGRVYHYFSRGVNEILTEARQYPDLAIEKSIVFIYERDFRFYLSKKGMHAGARYRDAIDQAMKKAKKKGLIDALVTKYWGENLTVLNYDQRKKIYLKTPEDN